MKLPPAKPVFTLFAAAFAIQFATPSARAEDNSPSTSSADAKNLELRTVLDDTNIELYSPRFIPNSSDFVVVRKSHEPDFHEAEAFSEKELKKSRNQKNSNPRWAGGPGSYNRFQRWQNAQSYRFWLVPRVQCEGRQDLLRSPAQTDQRSSRAR